MKRVLFLIFFLSQYFLNAQCNGTQSYTLTPTGPYSPGQVVTVNYTLNSFNQVNLNWIIAFDLDLGVGWASSSPLTAPANTGGSTGTWIWDTQNTYPSALNFGPGYRFNNTGGNPNWGTSSTGPFNLSFQLTVGASCNPQDLSISLGVIGDCQTGGWNNGACCTVNYYSIYNGNSLGNSTSTTNQTQCDIYTWAANNQTYNASGIYTNISTNAAGCDSVATLNLTINNSTASIDVQTHCDSYTWIDGVTYTSSNSTATFTSTNAAGCIDTETLNLTINNSTTNTNLQTACDSYTWLAPLGDGNTYTTSGNHTHISTNAAGCTHTEILDITINNSTANTNTQTACDSYTWLAPLGDGNTYTTSGTYTHTSTNAVGCIHTETLNLTINNSTTNTNLQTACDSYTWLAPLGDGNTYTTSGTYTHTSTNAVGCIHTETLNLTINNSTTNTNTQTACDSYTWLAPLGDGNTYTTSGNHTHISTNAAGCTHTETLNLTITNYTINTNSQNACDSYTWIAPLGDGNTYTTSGNYTHISTNAAGCTHTETLNLSINYSTTSIDVQTHCDSYTWIDGVTYNTSNSTATFPSTNLAGCTNIATLDLTINNSTTSSDVQVHCDSYTWIDGVTYTSSNTTATFQSTNLAGCTNTATLDLTINSSTTSTDVQVDCLPYTWLDGVTYTSSNSTATFQSTNAAGCTNIATLDLTITSITTSTDLQIHCDSYTWLDGVTYNASNNTATFQSTNAAGCTNIATLDLSINYSTTSTDLQVHCDTYTWLDGIIYTASNNTATFPSTNAAGCTNIATLDLTINNSTTSSDVQVHCDSYTWIDGVTYTTSNSTATFPSTNLAGCTNIATLDLTINNSSTTSFSISECDFYVWPGTGVSYNMSGTYIRPFITSNGCDSIVTLNLIIISGAIDITTNINITDVNCFGMANGAINLYPNGGINPLTFNWNNGATTQNINSITAGNYSFTITDAIGCTLDSTIRVSEPDELIVNFQANNVICRNDSISIFIELTNPNYNYYTVQFYDSIQKSFAIDSSGILIPEGIPFYIIPNFSNQIQLISIKDNNGCTSNINQTLDIIVKQLPILNITQDDVCEGTPSFTLNQGTPLGGDYFIDNQNTKFFDVENLENGAYTIKYEYTDIITNCSNSIEKIINISPNPIAKFSFSPQNANIDNPNILFVNKSRNIENTKWDLGDSTIIHNELEFWHTYSDTGTYKLIYLVNNNSNCIDSATATVIINPVCQIFIPSAFSPNNDGINDLFKVEIIGHKEYTMIIYNKWGEIIFHEKNGIWDGKRKNNVMQDGSYTYSILGNDFKDKPFNHTGTVSLIK